MADKSHVKNRNYEIVNIPMPADVKCVDFMYCDANTDCPQTAPLFKLANEWSSLRQVPHRTQYLQLYRLDILRPCTVAALMTLTPSRSWYQFIDSGGWTPWLTGTPAREHLAHGCYVMICRVRAGTRTRTTWWPRSTARKHRHYHASHSYWVPSVIVFAVRTVIVARRTNKTVSTIQDCISQMFHIAHIVSSKSNSTHAICRRFVVDYSVRQIVRP